MKKYALLFLIVLAFMAGGCGGSSDLATVPDTSQEPSDPDPAPAPSVPAIIDSNNDGVPDVFGYYDSDSYSDGRNAPDDGLAYDVPYLNYIHSSDTEEDGSFSANIYLTQGSEYVMKYSHSSRPLGEHDIDFTILTPDEKIIAFDFGFSSDTDEAPPAASQEASETAVSSDAMTALPEPDQPAESTSTPQEYISVSASIDILPPENPCIIFYTFTAPQTGVYMFTVREKQYSPASHDVPYELRIYRSDDDSALHLGGITMTPREMLDVQRRLVSYADEFNADGLPVSFRTEFTSEDVYSKMIQDISEDRAFSASVRAAADMGTYIKPVVEEVPYDVEFQPGTGFYAASGLRTLNETAFEDFTMPSPSTGAYVPTITIFKSIEIITEEEHNREQELEAMSTFALGKNALGQRALTAMNVRLAQVSKTILVRYDVIETNPRTVNVNTLKFSPEALEILNNYGAEDFSNEFGDYFVAGYKWGLRFQAIISVTSDSSSVLDKACAGIRSIVSLAQYGSSYSELIPDVEALGKSNYLNIDVEEVTIDGGNPRKGTFSTESSIKAVADALASFAKQAQSADRTRYSPVQVVLRRFREVPAAKNIIPELLPMPPSHFNAILELNKTILRTRCYYNALLSIPIANLVNGSALRNQWVNEFNTLLDTTKNQINYICDAESRAKDYQGRFQALCDKYRALCERYVFYRRLMEEQDNSKNKKGFWNSDSDKDEYVSAGIKTYAHSSIVMSDYGKYADSYHTNARLTEGAKMLSYWYWTVYGDQIGTNWRYVWFETGCHDTNNSFGEDRAFPTVGSKTFKWYFEGGTWRRVEWYFRNKIIKMPPDKYPFIGLQD